MKKIESEQPNKIIIEEYKFGEDIGQEESFNKNDNKNESSDYSDNSMRNGENVDNYSKDVDSFLTEMNNEEFLVEKENKNIFSEKDKEEDKSLSFKQEKLAKKESSPPKKEKTVIDRGFKNTYIYGFIFIVFSFILEIVNSIRLGFGLFPSNFGIEFSIILILSGIIFIVPYKCTKITLTSIFIGLQVVMNVANASLYMMCNDIITLDMVFTLGHETMDVFELNQIDIVSLIVSLIIVALFVLSIVFVDSYAPKFKIQKNRKAIFSLVFLLVSVEVIGVSSLNLFKVAYFSNATEQSIVDNDEYWYNSLNSKFTTFKKYGFWSFYINNAKTFFGYDKNLGKLEKEELIQYISSGENYLENNSVYNGNNVSGALAGENLVVIMMESMEWFAIDEFVTPELYKFINNEAISFNNYYSRNKTNISEQIALLGNIPNEYSLETVYNNVGINVPNSLPNLFKEAGYDSVKYFHNYSGKIYDRQTMYKSNNLGFDDVNTLEDFPGGYKQEYFGDFLGDDDYIKEFLSEFMPRDKSFFSFYTTMSAHGPYNKHSEKLKENRLLFRENYSKYEQYAKSKGWKTPKMGTEEYYLLEEYKARARELEKAFIQIMNYIEHPGKSIKDKTSIIMFADHNAYYSNMTSIVKGVDKFAKNKEQYNVPLVMYCSDEKFGSGEVDTFCNTYDLYPTICDLFGLSYNKNLTQGYSVFTNNIDKSVFVSSMSGMFDKNCFALTADEIITKDNLIQTNSSIAKFKVKLNTFFKKQDLIDKYYRINYEKNIANS